MNTKKATSLNVSAGSPSKKSNPWKYDFWLKIHKKLLENVWSWAGKIRTQKSKSKMATPSPNQRSSWGAWYMKQMLKMLVLVSQMITSAIGIAQVFQGPVTLRDGTTLHVEVYLTPQDQVPGQFPRGSRHYEMRVLNGPRNAIGPLPLDHILPRPATDGWLKSPSLVAEYSFVVNDEFFYQETVAVRPSMQGRGLTTALNEQLIVGKLYRGRHPNVFRATLIDNNLAAYNAKTVIKNRVVVQIGGSLKGLVPVGGTYGYEHGSTDDTAVMYKGDPNGRPKTFVDAADRPEIFEDTRGRVRIGRGHSGRADWSAAGTAYGFAAGSFHAEVMPLLIPDPLERRVAETAALEAVPVVGPGAAELYGDINRVRGGLQRNADLLRPEWDAGGGGLSGWFFRNVTKPIGSFCGVD